MNTLTSMNGYTVLGSPSPFFHLLELDVAEVDQHPDAIQDLRDGKLTGVIVHGVYDQKFLRQITQRLERHDPPFIKSWFPEKFRSWFYGQNLNLLETNAEAYFQEVPRFHQMLQELFSSSLSPDPYVTNILSRLDQSRPYRPAPGIRAKSVAARILGTGNGQRIPHRLTCLRALHEQRSSSGLNSGWIQCC